MILENAILKYLNKKGYSKNRILAILTIYYIVIYVLLTLLFYNLFYPESTIIPALLIFTGFFIYRINTIEKKL
jgi:hypothetical protein